MPEKLRDFLYLDIDKTRSLIAQAEEGYLESLQRTTLQAGGSDIKVLNYALEKSASETISVHHYLYSLLESRLLQKKRVLEVPGRSKGKHKFDWTEERFPDGGFVLTEGSIRLLDYGSMAGALAGFPTLIRVMLRFQEDALKKALQAGEITKSTYAQRLAESKKGMPETRDVQGITDLVKTLYGSALRVRLYPFDDSVDQYFAANLAPEYMQRQRAEVLGATGLASAGYWRLFGIMDRFETNSGAVGDSRASSNLEDVMLGMLEAFSAMGQFTLAVQWPVVAVTPIAVYREV